MLSSTSHPMLYEINTRCWLRELSDRAGQPLTLTNVPESEFAEWRRLGFTHIWLMGVWSSGPLARARALAHQHQQPRYAEALANWRADDVAGSPYAIGEYQVPPSLGGESGLRNFRERLHQAGLKLLLDFVPNHLGLDHRWVRERPELFVQGPSGAPGLFRQETASGIRWLAHGKDPYFEPWTDTVQLDYRRPETRAAMLGVVEKIAASCDGVRCDMAMLVLNDVFGKTWQQLPSPEVAPTQEFWAEAITSVKSAHPGFLFLAEAYWGTEPLLQSLGFDYTYDKALYDKLIARDSVGVQRHLLEMAPERLAAGAHFLENHDEPRVASLLAPEEHRAAALVILALPGMRFLYEGQLRGARRKIPVQLVRRPAEPEQPDVRRMYEQLLTTLPSTAVGQGRWNLIKPRPAWPDNPSGQNLVLIQWQADNTAFDLVAVNLASHASQCYAPLNMPSIRTVAWAARDLLGVDHFTSQDDELRTRGLYLDLPAHAAQLLHFDTPTGREAKQRQGTNQSAIP